MAFESGEVLDTNVRYDRHEEEWAACLEDPKRNATALSWLQSDTLNNWRHMRMWSQLKPVIRENASASWLTVGDGRFGTDGNALMQMGAQNIHCTDISDTLLKIGSEKGFINTFSAQNAESLNFSDNSFDYVYCKESFHHFPRPYIALHEMFRVAKKAVFLTEPRDSLVDRALMHPFLTLLKKLLGKSTQQHGFEPVGNYVYSISEREMEKFLLGMHFTLIGYHTINDAYEEVIEFVKLDSQTPGDKKKIRKLKFKIFLQDLLSKFGVLKPRLLSVALFKEQPDPSVLEKNDFKRMGN